MRAGRSINPAKGRAFSSGCAQSGNSGSGITIPQNRLTTEASRMATPSPLIVHSSEMLISVVSAALTASAPTSATSHSAPAAALAGGGSAHSRRPASGSRTIASSSMGTVRSNMGAVRQATARAYQKPYRSTGRTSS